MNRDREGVIQGGMASEGGNRERWRDGEEGSLGRKLYEGGILQQFLTAILIMFACTISLSAAFIYGHAICHNMIHHLYLLPL